MPVLARLQSEYQDQGFQVLAINTESKYFPIQSWAQFMNQLAPAGLEGLTEAMSIQDVNDQAGYFYNLRVLGTEVLVDRDGRIAFRSEGSSSYGKLKAEIEKVL